ncbi:hypothetical protein MTP99_015022 [Tenebrio molitor]|nr:hypothetical protein MTP99_015022 [Tenebrio molitor]
MKNELITLFMIISVCHGQTQGTTVNTPAVTEVKGSIISFIHTSNPTPKQYNYRSSYNYKANDICNYDY